MTMTPIRRHVEPSYAVLRDLVGREVTVVASVLDGHGVVPLTLECLSTPVCWDGRSTFSVRLDRARSTRTWCPAATRCTTRTRAFVLSLSEVARELRFVHYEAYLTEPL